MSLVGLCPSNGAGLWGTSPARARERAVCGGEPKRLTSAALRAEYPVWAPAGKEIVFSSKDSLWRLTVRAGGTPIRIRGRAGLYATISHPEPGKPARMVYVRSFVDWNFWRIETPALGAPSLSAPVPAISSTKVEYHIRFSPDGRRVAFTSGRSGDPETRRFGPLIRMVPMRSNLRPCLLRTPCVRIGLRTAR